MATSLKSIGIYILILFCFFFFGIFFHEAGHIVIANHFNLSLNSIEYKYPFLSVYYDSPDKTTSDMISWAGPYSTILLAFLLLIGYSIYRIKKGCSLNELAILVFIGSCLLYVIVEAYPLGIIKNTDMYNIIFK